MQILVIQLCQVHAYVSVFNHDLDILISFLNFHRLFHPETTVEVIFFMNIFSYALRYQVGQWSSADYDLAIYHVRERKLELNLICVMQFEVMTNIRLGCQISIKFSGKKDICWLELLA